MLSHFERGCPTDHLILPNELWFSIFTHLPPAALKDVFETSFRFRELSRSLRYRRLVLDPLCPCYAGPGHQHGAGWIDAWLGRLSAPPIATHVLELVISFQFLGALFGKPTGVHSPHAQAYVRPLLEAVHQFPRLRNLTLRLPFGWEFDLDALPVGRVLDELWIEGGILRSSAHESLRTKSFVYTNFPRSSSPCGETGNSFLAALNATHLASLTLYPSFDCHPTANIDPALCRRFAALRRLEVQGCSGPFVHDVHSIVAAFPAVEELVVDGEYRSCRCATPDRQLPPLAALRSYTGPADYAPIFLAGSRCPRVVLDTFHTQQTIAAVLAQNTTMFENVTEFGCKIRLESLLNSDVLDIRRAMPRASKLELYIADLLGPEPLDEDEDDLELHADGLSVSSNSRRHILCADLTQNLPCILASQLMAAKSDPLHVTIDWELCCEVVDVLGGLEPVHRALMKLVGKQAVRVDFRGGVREWCSRTDVITH
ncbi:unnamed protein product [Mycena citricolor]|uniref:F-box domain-containing protein n=1 Tax=Mycena citricolor TaxID=2018698 RepID=A0AAD2HJL2_9AGAR|nr:unnamed protein product [Mycena citricolor]